MGLLSSLFGLGGSNQEEIKKMLESGAQIIDVRTVGEFKSGNAKGSKNIPLSELNNRLQELKGKDIVLVCKSGGRASQAQNILKRNGINAVNAGAWQNVG